MLDHVLQELGNVRRRRVGKAGCRCTNLRCGSEYKCHTNELRLDQKSIIDDNQSTAVPNVVLSTWGTKLLAKSWRISCERHFWDYWSAERSASQGRARRTTAVWLCNYQRLQTGYLVWKNIRVNIAYNVFIRNVVHIFSNFDYLLLSFFQHIRHNN